MGNNIHYISAGLEPVDVASGSPPGEPSLSVTNDGNGTAVTATVDGDAGATNKLYYRKAGDSAWTAGSSRSGDGDIAQSGLTPETRYQFVIVSDSGGFYSIPSNVVALFVTDTTTATTPSSIFATPLKYLRDSLAASATFQTLVGAGDAAAALAHIHYFGLNHPRQWAATTAYALRDFVRLAAGGSFIYECTVDGTSGSDEPTWPTGDDQTVADGTVTWTARAMQDGGDPDMATIRHSRPLAVVGLGEDYNLEAIAAGAAHSFGDSGQLMLYLEADVPAGYQDTLDDAGIWWTNQVGNIIDELTDTAGASGYLNIRGVSLEAFVRPYPHEHRNEGDCFKTLLAIEWSYG